MEFLWWYSALRGMGKSVLYLEGTLDVFRRWKLDVLLTYYAGGATGFKQLYNLGKISFQEVMLLVQKNGIELPIPEVVDNYTGSYGLRTDPNISGYGLSYNCDSPCSIRVTPLLDDSHSPWLPVLPRYSH